MAAFHDPRIRYVTRTHAGQCRARNHALALARGALIAYLDSDNVWYPGISLPRSRSSPRSPRSIAFMAPW